MAMGNNLPFCSHTTRDSSVDGAVLSPGEPDWLGGECSSRIADRGNCASGISYIRRDGCMARRWKRFQLFLVDYRRCVAIFGSFPGSAGLGIVSSAFAAG